ncbi:RidA family protein [Paenibacillus ihumii]|uniref:RidA family protein n=1 Tax=Paenibacillus ihumii TaxID=687436 RepID=UPI0006D7A77D|nr:RidA family protein [Paenibacillus ihumii]
MEQQQEKQAVATTEAPGAIGPYSQAIRFGSLLFTSGQLGMDASGVFPPTVEEQTKRSLLNVKAILEAAGYGMEDVVKTTVFLKDMNDFAAVNAVYAEFFAEPYPARSAVEVARLPKDGLVEIEVVAAKA